MIELAPLAPIMDPNMFMYGHHPALTPSPSSTSSTSSSPCSMSSSSTAVSSSMSPAYATAPSPRGGDGAGAGSINKDCGQVEMVVNCKQELITDMHTDVVAKGALHPLLYLII
ncbi:unnamed protein product, partial [Meganyctiphanes norvegica]